jgi:hypothetical protein
VVGRVADADLVLVDEMVSRRHAKLSWHRGTVCIEDLGSTNGTFVNGRKITRTAIKMGDRVIIGTSIMRLVRADPDARSHDGDASVPPGLPKTRTMSGAIDEIPLPDLMQLLGSSRKSGVLVVTGQQVGRICFRAGVIVRASLDGTSALAPAHAVYRMLRWTKGRFDLEPLTEGPLDHEVNLTVTKVLMDGLGQLDQLNQLGSRLPPSSSRLTMTQPLRPSLKDLSPNELDLFQMAINAGNVEALLDQSGLSDLDAAMGLVKLLEAGYLRAE